MLLLLLLTTAASVTAVGDAILADGHFTALYLNSAKTEA